jgi:hypothetical protein
MEEIAEQENNVVIKYISTNQVGDRGVDRCGICLSRLLFVVVFFGGLQLVFATPLIMSPILFF